MVTSPGPASYAQVLRLPGARLTFALALLGRLSYGIVSLSLLLTVTTVTGSYATAGAVLALFGLASSVLSPFRARLLDRRGLRQVLPAMAAGYALLLLALALTTGWDDRPLILLLGAGAGACTPPLGPVMRTLWADLIPDRDLLQRAYSLDTVAEECLYVVGPLLVGLFTVYAGPALGLVVSAVLVFTGALGLVLFSPVLRGRDRPAEPTAAVPSAGWLWPAPNQGLRTAMMVTAGLGAGLGTLNLLTVAFARAHHHVAAVAGVEAALAVGSVVGGLAYGARSWRTALPLRLPILAALLGLALAATGQAPNLVGLGVGVAVTGLFFSPSLATAYLVAELGAAGRGRTEAGAWVNTSFNLGTSAGLAGIAPVIGLVSLRLSFVIAAAVVLLPAGITAVQHHRRHRAGR